MMLANPEGDMNTLQAIGALASCIAVAGTAFGADSAPSVARQLLGRWESTTFVATNFHFFTGTETNLVLCVYEVELQTTNAATKAVVVYLDVELRSKDRVGNERLVCDSYGSALVTDNNILFGGPGGFGFSYWLTNGLLTFEKSGRFTYEGVERRIEVKTELKKVSAQAGKRLWPWPAELDGAAPLRSTK